MDLGKVKYNIDWKDAFPNQCYKLGVQAFLNCGVRTALILVLITYFINRSVTVKWLETKPTKRKVPGGSPEFTVVYIWTILT